LVSHIGIVLQKHTDHTFTDEKPTANMKHTPIIALLALASDTLAHRCYCGYSVNTTDDASFGLFTHIAETDFLHAESTSEKFNFKALGWEAEVYNKTAEQAERAVGFSTQVGNVLTNALPEGKWGGPPATVGDAGLQLWLRHELESDLVSVAAVDNLLALGHDAASQMLYGSYRAAIKFSGMNGTRGAFGWESREGTRKQSITMAYASQEAHVIALTVRRTDTAKPDDDAENYDVSYESILNFPEEFHEFRFDWMPDRINFYIDGQLILTEDESVPDSAGTLSLKHYVDDGVEDPPAQDAVMTVGYVKAYYNTTTRDEPLPGCKDLSKDVCFLPGQTTPPNPNGKKTHFYSPLTDEDVDEQGKDDSTIGGSGWAQPDAPDSAASTATLWSGLLSTSVVLVAVYGIL
jgi:hypothetical protein